MHNILKALVIPGLLAVPVFARDVPSNVRSLYDSIRSSGSCSNVLKDGFYSQEGDTRDFCYCGDHLASDGIIYLQGKGGQLVNMDIDCDGALGTGDGSCDSSTDTQGNTTFRDTVQSYNKGIDDLNAYVHSFVVLGNQGSKDGYVEFDPQSVGIEPLSIVAVVCADKMIYGVWGDTNGDDGLPLIGEVSVSLGHACYGDAVNGNQAHDANDILYIAFTGQDAVPGADGAKWDSATFDEFEASLQAQGDRLIAKLGSGTGTAKAKPSKTTSTKGGSSPTSPGGGNGSLNPNCAPGGNFDLAYFNLQLPVGGPDIIKSKQLQGCGGYTGDTFFTDKSTGEMVLLAPGNPDLTGCATTSGSAHCRTELREVVKGSGANAAWSPKGINSLTVTMKVVTSDDGTHGTAIGQVFASEASKPLAEMYYSPSGDIVVGVKPDADSDQVVTKLGNVALGTKFTYSLNYSNDKLSISINGKATALDTFSWDSPACYFKSGNYNQGKSAASSEVRIYSINVVHS
ncbi:Putative Glycoside hydrolase family 75 protein [[Torrubiella] hemipterigena]|uniref:Endo-chitosanase n=1 Tax=[Torrubiella] hemipterigena TaxID=1531966 RepID=A0A0A1SNS6_9HYPO|nr:Putative Glycoside hydrolase family 75 protein [[Torrubiella] hemipterigena]